ncbi:MAG TPA: aminotransferase class V-fold PLP-dependent enzyme [Thermoanaerobaculia bacterium]|nr:aminotransferase class V-fold PLP-dependent enzyme [Thermoanaerobaculia bacterium]
MGSDPGGGPGSEAESRPDPGPAGRPEAGTADLLALRAEFPILERCTYLVSNSLGAMPRGVRDELAAFAGAWDRRGVRAWHEGWWEMAVETGDLLAPLLGVGPGQVAMHRNVSVAAGVFLSCLDYPPERNRLVSTELEFPSLLYLAEGERRRGAEIVLVPSEDGLGIATERLLAAIDERTRVVAVSHVLFRSAFVQDAAAIAHRCREVGALLLLDVYQSAGTLPLALAEWGVHAAVGGSVKWLCGGPGAGWLWVDPRLAPRLRPALTGWQADEEPFAFRPGPMRPAAGAWRFLTGTPNVPALHSCRPGYRIVAAVGAEAIRRRSLELTGRLMAAARDAGFEVRTPEAPERRGGTVSVGHPEAERLCRELLARDIVCDFRPGAGVRLSPHFYTTEAECDHAIATLAALRGPR